jgi:hypothetical protein
MEFFFPREMVLCPLATEKVSVALQKVGKKKGIKRFKRFSRPNFPKFIKMNLGSLLSI